MIKRLSLIILLIICSSPGFSQNWVNYNFNYQVQKLHYSATTNKLIVGGYFTKINNVNIYGIATYDGINFDSLGSGINYTASIVSVNDIEEYNNNLYICGGIQGMGNKPIKNIAKWDGVKWDSLGVQLNATVYAMKVFNNELYVGGYFWKVGNNTAYGIIKYDGTNWIPLGNGVPFNTTGHAIVHDIEAFTSEIYVAGEFSDSSGDFQLAKFDGTNWSRVLGLNSSLAEINTLKVYNNNLYIGGRFLKSSGDPGNNIAKFDGTNWACLDSGITGLSVAHIDELKVINNKLFITGTYNSANGAHASSIAYWNDTIMCALNLGNQQMTFSTIEWYNNTIFTNGNYTVLGNDTVKFLASVVPSSLNYNCSTVIINSVKENSSRDNTIKFYPNPVSDKCTIEISDNYKTKLEIINSLGQVVYAFSTINLKEEINLGSLSSGIYYLKVQSSEGQKLFKLIKQ